MGLVTDAVNAIRQILDPEIGRLNEKAANIERTLDEIKGDLKGLVGRVAQLESNFSRLEGRYERAEDNIILKIENRLLRQLPKKIVPEKPSLKGGRRTRR